MQEFILARNPIFCARRAQCPWSVWQSAMEKCKHFSLFSSSAALTEVVTLDWPLRRYNQYLATLDAIRQYYQSHGSLSIDIALKLALNLKASDTRDFVYGLSGLLTNEERERLDIDYTRPAVLIFTHVLSEMCDAGTLMQFLCSQVLNIPGHTSKPHWIPASIYTNVSEGISRRRTSRCILELLSAVRSWEHKSISIIPEQAALPSPCIAIDHTLHATGVNLGIVEYEYFCTATHKNLMGFDQSDQDIDLFWHELQTLYDVLGSWGIEDEDPLGLLFEQDCTRQWDIAPETYMRLGRYISSGRSCNGPLVLLRDEDHYTSMRHQFAHAFAGMKISYITEIKRFCICVPEVEVGDRIAAFKHCPLAFAVRSWTDGSHHLIGQVMVLGGNVDELVNTIMKTDPASIREFHFT